MSQAYDQAMNNRGLVDRLMEKLPGYRGYIDRDARQEADRLHRDFVSKRIAKQKNVVKVSINEFMEEGGDLSLLTKFEKVNHRIDFITAKIDSASYGSAKLFGASAASEEELRKLHEFDLSLVDCAEEIEREVGELSKNLDDNKKTKDTIKSILKTLDRVEEHFEKRERIIKMGD